jgi:tRNA 2-thiouridine synthesizing protein A
MSIETIDFTGLKTPQCVLKLAAKATHMKPGDMLEVTGDCPTFEKDLTTWCEGTGATIVSMGIDGERKNKIARIQF